MSAGVKRIVYLGGIVAGDGSRLSPHLRSRAEVGDILLASSVPAAALQAAVIIGSGSASFEMLRPADRLVAYVRLWDNLWNDQYVKHYRLFNKWTSDQIPFPGECSGTGALVPRR